MVLGLNFIGLSYLLVYVGAVSILFLFILMLINVRISELTTNNNNSIPLSIMISIYFFFMSFNMLPNNFYNVSDINKYSIKNSVYFPNTNDVHYVTSNIWDGALVESSHITSIGNVIYTAYPMWLILTSLILLLAMVGAIIITLKPKNV